MNKVELIPDQSASWVMRNMNRRTFLKDIAKCGAVLGGIVTGVIGGGLGIGPASAQSPCPPPLYGDCLPCGSLCLSGGQACYCYCPDDCNCALYMAACLWVYVVPDCNFVCECLPC